MNLTLNIWKIKNVFKKLPQNYKDVIKNREIYCYDCYGQEGIAYLAEKNGKLLIVTLGDLNEET